MIHGNHINKSSGNKSNPYASYDSGYDSIYEDGDYDWDRYQKDKDYADGVDDAMDELDEDPDTHAYGLFVQSIQTSQ